MRIGLLLRKYRAVQELTLRQLAPEIGISVPTLGRIENGHECDADTLMKLFNWLTGVANG